jgi:hypothetical protein
MFSCTIKFADGVELQANSKSWEDIELFMRTWNDRPWFRISICNVGAQDMAA